LEPISYLRAPIRRWPVAVSIALVAVIVALLVPVGSSSVYPANTWKAASDVGLAPRDKANGLGARVGAKQLEYYAHTPAVIAAAAKADGVPLTNKLRADILVSKAKKQHAHGSILAVSVLQPTKQGAASLTNAFVAALTSYTQLQFVGLQKTQVATQQAYIANLEKAIADLPKKPKKIKKPTLPPTTTTTRVIKKVVRKKPKKAESVRVGATGGTNPRAESVSVASDTAKTGRISGRIELADTAPPIATAPTTPTTTVTGGSTQVTTIPPTGVVIVPSTTPTTESYNAKTVAEEQRVLSAELASAIGALQKMTAQGSTSAGIQIISPANPNHAVKLNPNPPLLANAFLRGLLGLVIGALLGVAATWLLDALDKRLRTSKRAEEVFGLPVIVEIPSAGSEPVSAIPVVDVIVDPYSPTSEAYRRLHVAILTAPPVTWVKRGYGYQDDLLELARLQAPQELLVAASATGGVPNDLATGSSDQMRLPVPVGSQALAKPHRPRFSILVTAPTDEPTRSLVVVNLAAVFAEAGDRVLVATTGGMRTSIDGNGKMPPTWEGPYSELTASELVANARPSQIPGVSSLALGQLFPNPSKLALNARGLVEAARDVVDVVLFEAPLLSTQDGTALMQAADLVVVVCEAWRTTVNDGAQSQRLLAQHRPPVLGIVMTNMRADHPSLTVAP
jgi:Mrp family chromosome partitioning ATPase